MNDERIGTPTEMRGEGEQTRLKRRSILLLLLSRRVLSKT